MTTETVTCNESETLKGVSRRDLLIGAGVVASVAVAGTAIAGSETESHAMHHKYFEATAYKKHVALVAATNECIAKGQACISHCMETFVAGDTTMGKCAFAVQQMLPVCTAMAYLAAYDSKRLKPMAETCVGVCEDCEKECRVHQDHQPECRACADACAALIKEAKKLLA
jgi:Cys-rich four helix bundle protein (predicted Tat secretion target)